jgi:nicotinamide-nucleotide amidase
VDDKTRDAVARATDRELFLDEDLLAYITEFIKRRGFKLGENNPRQAQIPSDSIPIHNPVGTAPGFIVSHNDSYVISLPGVPRELHYLMENTVLPFLTDKFGLQAVIKTRLLRTAGEGESAIDRLIAEFEESSNPTVGLAAHPGAVDIRISAKAEHEDDALKMLDDMETRVRQRVGDKRKLSIAIVETNTGGFITHMLTNVPRGFDVNVQTQVMSCQRVVDMLPDGFKFEETVSSGVAENLARAICKKADTDIGLAIVGDDDPEVGPYSERTGDTYVGVNIGNEMYSRHIHLGGISKDARTRIFNASLAMLRKCLLKTLAG